MMTLKRILPILLLASLAFSPWLYSAKETIQISQLDPLIVEVLGAATAATTGDEKKLVPIPSAYNGRKINSVQAHVANAGTTGTLNVDIAVCANVATGDQCSGTVSDLLSTNLTIDTGESNSSTADAAAVIDDSVATVNTGDFLRFDIDAIHSGTASDGLYLIINFN